jgi:hypothetical protein
MHVLGKSNASPAGSSLSSSIYSEREFWSNFFEDLKTCNRSLVIASPFLTNDATWKIAGELKELRKRQVQIVVYTRPPEEHLNRYSFNLARSRLENAGINVTSVSKINRKLAIIDDAILWEGSLIILGFRDSHERMRRFQGEAAQTLLRNLNLGSMGK